jgi:hypothetical protein
MYHFRHFAGLESYCNQRNMAHSLIKRGLSTMGTLYAVGFTNIRVEIHENTKPSARMGRKAHGSP